ncbi:MAG: type I-E CRISPR-associated protein Cas5/CasD [Candidatus Schekmanbacteria bacterium RBG_13_48_7]|uniref:Type I-E CRISPR-associated protein Cas5/CasD n=1 Tax=Candidatus Schekmanbacteria bacterium RBG_13_48_7 TaxID=1817878 RepID=A0A1F7S4K4_9BACT|nr:MAG: type I-E CRISPR-associated protein Cas5/CasD [Candidatus Schekmanbacteria bacterium RBG_13_48_7]
MNCVLLMPFVAPMQSWGTRSRFQERDTEREPSKSGVIGLLCAALGRDRSEPIDDLTTLRMGVRVDIEGLLRTDFQTVQNVIVASGEKVENQISNRHYLADAAFLVGLEGDEQLLRNIHAALANPVWHLFLGRKSYVASLPVYQPDGLKINSELRTALIEYPLLCNVDTSKDLIIRIVMECNEVTHESRMDNPVSFAYYRREFRERFIKTEYVPIRMFSCKEAQNVPVKNTT